jgi:hypothetical protein
VTAVASATLFIVLTTGQRDLAVRILTLLACAAVVWSGRRLLIPALVTVLAVALFALRPFVWSAFPLLPLGSHVVQWGNLQILGVTVAAFSGFFSADLFQSLGLRRTLRAAAVAGLFALLLFVSPPGRRRPQPQWRGWSFVQNRWARLALPGRALRSSWFQLQVWIRENTPKGTLFFTPPGPLGFRVFSARSPFIEYADGEVGIFDPGLAREWKRRMEIIGCWPPAVGNTAVSGAGVTYHALAPERWIELAREHQVDYLITSRPIDLWFPKLYAVGEYTLWKIPNSPAPGARRPPD